MDLMETRLSLVDGAAGRLIVAGHDLEALAAVTGGDKFERVCGLLLGDGPATARDWRARLGPGRRAAFAALGRIGDALAQRDGMDARRAGLAHFATDDPAEVIGAVAVIAAAWIRA